MRNNPLENLSKFMMALAKFFVKLAIFCVVIYFIGIRLFDFGHKLFYEKPVEEGQGREVVFEIKQGDSEEVVAENLKKAGLIEDTIVFRFRAKIYKKKLKPNTYTLKTSMTIKNMLDIFDE